jgi:hypothetical protein
MIAKCFVNGIFSLRGPKQNYVFTGEPGIGKSAIVAAIRPDLERAIVGR